VQWRAVDSDGEVLEILIQPQRDNAAALRLLRKLFRRQGFVPTVIVNDKLRSYGAALRVIGFSGLHEQGLRANNRAENSHQLLRPHRVYCGWRCPRWTIAPEKDSPSTDGNQGTPRYEVGYCKPPTTTRFQKGKSGSPRGRPKEARDKLPAINAERMKSILIEEAYRAIKVRDGSREVTIPMIGAVVRSMALAP
jgi:DDE domain/Family of unknown function (DUF5681)